MKGPLMPEDFVHDDYIASFDPGEYLRQYYSLPQLAVDDAELFCTLCGWLKETGHFYPSVLDVGCGPTIHNTFAIAPYAGRIDLADYLPTNLSEIRKWLNAERLAHDWDPLFRGVLACEESVPDQLENRKALYRSRVSRLLRCDLNQPEPISEPSRYDLVTSFFCAECVARDETEWESMVGRILNLLNADSDDVSGVFFACIRNSRFYRVLGREFDAVSINECDLRDIVASHGFRQNDIQSVCISAPDWVGDGFESIGLVYATRR